MIQSGTQRLLATVGALLLTLGATAGFAQEPPLKVAVVNVERIVSESTAGKALQTKLDNFREQIETDLQARLQAVNKLRQDAALAADPAEQSRLQREYEDGARDLRRLQDDKQREGQKMQDEGLREIEKNLAPVFRQIRDEQGYDLILALTPGIVLMVSERVDITQVVLDRYNAASE